MRRVRTFPVHGLRPVGIQIKWPAVLIDGEKKREENAETKEWSSQKINLVTE